MQQSQSSHKNNSFSITTPEQWSPEESDELINKLIDLLELRSQYEIKLHVKQFEKRCTRIEIENSDYNLAVLMISKLNSLQNYRE